MKDVDKRKLGGMTPEEFRLKAKEVADWVRGFCRSGAKRLPDEDDYMSVLFSVAYGLEQIADASDKFAAIVDKYVEKESGKVIEIPIKVNKIKS